MAHSWQDEPQHLGERTALLNRPLLQKRHCDVVMKLGDKMKPTSCMRGLANVSILARNE